MSFLSSSYKGPREVSYLFIDGAYLRNVIERFETDLFSGNAVPLDYRKLAGNHTKVFYYDCPPTQRHLETAESFEGRVRLQESLYRNLRSLRGWHIYEGVVKRTGKRAKQKEVDILIAVDMLTHAYRRNMHGLTFLAGDQDFRPLVDALVRDGMFVELLYDPVSISADLADAADSRHPIDPYTFFEWLEESFKRAHPLPERSSGTKEEMIPQESPIEIADTDRGTAQLFHVRGRYLIVRAYPEIDGQYLRMRHSDLELLKATHAKTYGPCEWRSGV